MPAKVIDGEAVASKICKEVAERAQELAAKGHKPQLTAVQVGENPASKIYTNMQAKSCQEVGIGYQLLNLPAGISQDDLLGEIARLNTDPTVSGIILQMPLPQQIDARQVQVVLAPHKDVEGMGPVNMGRLFYGGSCLAPCTPLAAVELLRLAAVEQFGGDAQSALAGRETVVVGHSEIVGKPIAMILLQSLNAAPTITVCHVATKDLASHTRRAEVLIVATGVSQARWLGYQRRKKAGENPQTPDLTPLIKGDMVREGAIVIDVAINRIPKALDAKGDATLNEKGKADMMTVGDVDCQAASQRAAAITPVPGGVGPVTVAMLLRNTIQCAKSML
ncbi:MAG: bifunctional 5,10-methylenetetrahydrofolate dehydrogenase/5,10-methenyltetrahydrofolate cyclohydrolase [Planctomycetes bacterium]|nr:bifunctional 5,10-methylenetetrahydrofolate dehydrogenase/5,10-methenyltetrahydrofolate cyclohydrolase [Planctomycetota bacterium]